MALIELLDIEFRWPGNASPTLSIPQFSLQSGVHTFLHGPSGSGKSTLLSLLTGIQAPQRGSLRILGEDLSRMRAPRRDRFRADHIGYVFQQFNLLPYLSVLDNVMLPCQVSALRRQRAGDARAAAGALLETLGMQAHLHTPASRLSVGMQQRVAVARALIGRPELLIADEPTSALDADMRQRFVELLLANTHETTVLLVSHDHLLAQYFPCSLALGAINLPAEVPHA
jgi:putative ABC transport system ATP-binding protein